MEPIVQNLLQNMVHKR